MFHGSLFEYFNSEWLYTFIQTLCWRVSPVGHQELGHIKFLTGEKISCNSGNRLKVFMLQQTETCFYPDVFDKVFLFSKRWRFAASPCWCWELIVSDLCILICSLCKLKVRKATIRMISCSKALTETKSDRRLHSVPPVWWSEHVFFLNYSCFVFL